MGSTRTSRLPAATIATGVILLPPEPDPDEVRPSYQLGLGHPCKRRSPLFEEAVFRETPGGRSHYLAEADCRRRDTAASGNEPEQSRGGSTPMREVEATNLAGHTMHLFGCVCEALASRHRLDEEAIPDSGRGFRRGTEPVRQRLLQLPGRHVQDLDRERALGGRRPA